MWDLVKSFFAFGLATSLEKLIAYFLLPLYTDVFSVTEYGYIDLIQVTIIIITTFSVLQFETSLQRYYYVYKGYVKAVFISTVFNTILLCSVVTTAIALGTFGLYKNLLFGTYNADLPFQIACLQIPFSNIIMLLLLVARFEKRSLLFSLSVISKITLTVGLTYLFIVYYEWGIKGVFGAQLLSNILIAVLLWYKNRDKVRMLFSQRIFYKMWKYAYPQIPARFGSVLSANLNRYLMIGYLSVAAIGIYSLALKIASVMQLVYTAFILAWTPFIFKQIKEANHRIVLGESLSLIACPVLFAVICISLFSQELVGLVSRSEEYQDSIHLVGGLALYFSFFIFKEIVDIGPRFKERTIYISVNYLFSLIINIILLLLLIRYWGEKGVVISMICTNIILFVSSWYFSNRLYPINFRLMRFSFFVIPAFCLILLTMYYKYDLELRLIMLLGSVLFYGSLFLVSIKSYRKRFI